MSEALPTWVQPNAVIYHRPTNRVFVAVRCVRDRHTGKYLLSDATNGKKGRQYWVSECSPVNQRLLSDLIQSLHLPKINIDILCEHRYGVLCRDLNDKQVANFVWFLSQWEVSRAT
jgi:hypothetical protein